MKHIAAKDGRDRQVESCFEPKTVDFVEQRIED